MEIELKNEIIISDINNFAKQTVYKITKGGRQIFTTPNETGIVLEEGITHWKEVQDIGDESEYLFGKALLVNDKVYLSFTIHFVELTPSVEKKAQKKLLEAAKEFDDKIK